jgi:SAM-dependent methyltransferase
MTESENWPGRIGEKYQVIDWNCPAADVAAAINKPTGMAAVSFTRGVKIALAQASSVDGQQAGAAPGTLLTRVDGPIDIAAADGIVRVARYAVEGRIDFWYFEQRMAEFLDHFPEVFPQAAPVTFAVTRFELFQNVLDRFTVAFGIERPRGQAARPEPPHADSVLRGGSHLYAHNREWLLQLYQRLGLKPGARVLDIGCGGVWTSIAAREAGLEAWGCDLYVDSFYDSVSDWFHYFQCNIADMGPLPVKFDLIFFRGLTPLAYARNLLCPELVKFRDRIIEGLNEGGTVFTEHYSNNSGKPRSPNDFGCSTVAQLHEWMGRFFPHTEYTRGQYITMLASHQPIREVWPTGPIAALDLLSEKDFAELWRTLRLRSIDDATYFLLLLKVSQAFFRRRPLRAGGPVFVLGTGPFAADLRLLFQQIQRSFVLRGVGAELPATLPPDTFVFVLPDAKAPDPMPFDHYKITYAELIGRTAARDFWSTTQDHDIGRVRHLLDVRARRESERRTRSLPAKPDQA